MEEAVEWVKRSPFQEGELEIRPVFEADDFGEEFTPELREQEERLRNWMLGRHLEPAGAAVYAYYNDPFTPGFLRRNEIIIPITAGPSTLW